MSRKNFALGICIALVCCSFCNISFAWAYWDGVIHGITDPQMRAAQNAIATYEALIHAKAEATANNTNITSINSGKIFSENRKENNQIALQNAMKQASLAKWAYNSLKDGGNFQNVVNVYDKVASNVSSVLKEEGIDTSFIDDSRTLIDEYRKIDSTLDNYKYLDIDDVGELAKKTEANLAKIKQHHAVNAIEIQKAMDELQKEAEETLQMDTTETRTYESVDDNGNITTLNVLVESPEKIQQQNQKLQNIRIKQEALRSKLAKTNAAIKATEAKAEYDEKQINAKSLESATSLAKKGTEEFKSEIKSRENQTSYKYDRMGYDKDTISDVSFQGDSGK